MRYIFSISAGIYSVSYFPYLPTLWVLLVIFLIAVLLIFLRYYLVVAFLAGVLYGNIYGINIISAQLSEELNGKSFIVEGTVVDLPKYKQYKNKYGYDGKVVQKFHLKLHDVSAIDTNIDSSLVKPMIGKKVSLSWSSYKNISPQSLSDIPLLKPGDDLQLKVKLKRPRGFVNPAGFDYHLYLLQQDIMATGYVRSSIYNKQFENRCHFLFVDCWRGNLRQYILDNKEDNTQESLVGPLLGLLIGDKQLITQEQWLLLRNTGAIHLLAISGLHIGLAAVIGALLGKFFQRVGQLFWSCNRVSWLVPVFSILCAALYSCLAGLSLPTLRAMVMIMTYHIFAIALRKISPWLLVNIALFVMALIDPLSVRSQGFWLSFLAVATLLLSFRGYFLIRKPGLMRHSYRHIKSLFEGQWALAIGLLLPSIFLVQGISIIAALANFIAVPLVSFVTVPLLFLGLLLLPISGGLSTQLFSIAEASLALLFKYLTYINELSTESSFINLSHPSYLAMACITICSIILLLPKGFIPRWLCLFCFLPVFFVNKKGPLLRVTFLDVGQGTAVVVETKKHQLVYDAGRQFSDTFNAGEHILAPYLFQESYNSINRLIVSHSDNDHSGGVAGLNSVVTINDIYAGEPQKGNEIQCQQGQEWSWDGVSFSILWPSHAFLNGRDEQINSNNLSCVLSIGVGQKTLILAGDIEKLVETELLKEHSLSSNVDILLVPHHGSKTSSHSDWVKTLNPDYAVVTAGYLNSYGHPNNKVVKRYQESGSEIINTGVDGAVRFTLTSANTWKVERWRSDHGRYWYD
jgi:competence protein ComEC